MVCDRFSSSLGEVGHCVELVEELFVEHLSGAGTVKDGRRCRASDTQTETTIDVLHVQEAFEETIHFGCVGERDSPC